MGKRIESSSSIKRPPELKWHLLKVSSKCSGTYLIGASKISRRRWYDVRVDSLRRLSTTSGWLQTSINSGVACRFVARPSMAEILRVLYAKEKVLSSLVV